MASNVQDLEKQKEALENLVRFLEQFIEQLGQDMTSYSRYVDNLLIFGVSKQTYNHYQEAFKTPLSSRMSGVISGIKDFDLPYLRDNIEGIEEAIKRAHSGGGEY